MLQESSAPESLTVAEAVDLVRHYYPFALSLDDILDRADLSEKRGNRIAQLSGGQQQRLAIARALVKKAPILIMDEATSSLDAISENRIKQAIRSLQGKVTQILIAHRLSTIEHADRIIFIDHGKKIGEGTLQELLATCTPFKILWETYHHSEILHA